MTGRAERLDARLAEADDGAGVDLLLVNDLANVRYLTGFTGSNGLVVTGPGIRRFVTDFRYVERAGAEVRDFEVERSPSEFLAALADGWPPGELRLGFEDHKVTMRQHARLRELVPDRIRLVPAGGLVERERAVKDAEELTAIRAAAALADDAMRELLAQPLTGRRERDVALALEDAMRRRGAEPAFGTIVAAGVHGALPHATPTDAAIPGSVLVTIDWGAQLDGYCSDCTRTIATGPVDGRLQDVYELVRTAQAAGLDALRPGPDGREVDAVARRVIEEAGEGEHFGHGLGHGVGLEVHEAPRLGKTSRDVVQAGNVVTVEPGVYVPGTGGVRIEDLVAVTEDGCEVLSSLSKDFLVLD